MLSELLVHQLRLKDGTIVRSCPTPKLLYCSRDGRFFSPARAVLTDDGWEMHEIKVNCARAGYRSKKVHSTYPHLADYGASSAVHHLMWETWVGPRKKTDADGVKWEIDHINGDILNWSLDNLEEVTDTENRRRRRTLQRLRKEGIDPTQIPFAKLKQIFEYMRRIYLLVQNDQK